MDDTQQEIDTEKAKSKPSGAKWLRSKHAGWVLGLIAFAESLFAPILIDPFLVALILAKRERWMYYVTISVVCSVIGGIAAYILGSLFFEFIGTKVITLYGFEERFISISKSLAESGFVFVLVGALTPIPYKLVAIASGLVHVPFLTFLFASIFGRILRLALVGYAAYAVGPRALSVFQKHLLKLAYLFLALFLVYIILQFI